MTALYIILGIILLIALILSLRAKVFLRLDDGLTIKAGAWFILITLLPKKDKTKKRRRPLLSSFSYKNHQRRLKRDAKKEAKKAAKAAKKAEKKRLKRKTAEIGEQAKKAAAKAEKSLGEKLEGIFELVSFILEEFPRLASYIHTDVRELKINVASGDAAKTAEIYGGVSALSAALIELLACRTKLKPMKDDAIAVNADFFGTKTSATVDISMQITLFSVLRVGWHTLKWFIGQKIKNINKNKT